MLGYAILLPWWAGLVALGGLAALAAGIGFLAMLLGEKRPNNPDD
jgi:hypothetical protein